MAKKYKKKYYKIWYNTYNNDNKAKKVIFNEYKKVRRKPYATSTNSYAPPTTSIRPTSLSLTHTYEALLLQFNNL